MQVIHSVYNEEDVTFEISDYGDDDKADVFAIPHYLYIGLVEQDGDKFIALAHGEYCIVDTLEQACKALLDALDAVYDKMIRAPHEGKTLRW